MPQVLGETRIRELREWYGLSQPEFARAVGVSAWELIRWELGEVTPTTLARRSLALFEDLRARLITRYGEKAAQEWLRQPNRALDGNLPIDVVIVLGPTLVRDILVRAEAGTCR